MIIYIYAYEYKDWKNALQFCCRNSKSKIYGYYITNIVKYELNPSNDKDNNIYSYNKG